MAGGKPAMEQSRVAGSPLEQRSSRSAPAAPGFIVSRGELGFRAQPEAAHADFSSLTATFAPWRTLGKHLCQKGSSPM